MGLARLNEEPSNSRRADLYANKRLDEASQIIRAKELGAQESGE